MTALQEAIKASGLSQKEISIRTGIKYKTVNRQGITGIKTARVARRYAEVLGCDWRELFDDDAPACTCAGRK